MHRTALAVLALLALDSCCTQAECFDEVVIELTASTGVALPPGEYTIDIGVDGETQTCSASVTASDATTTCDGYAQPRSIELRLLGAPEFVELRVERDGDLLVDSDLEPAYERNAPNGELCGPICDRAVVGIEL